MAQALCVLHGNQLPNPEQRLACSDSRVVMCRVDLGMTRARMHDDFK